MTLINISDIQGIRPAQTSTTHPEYDEMIEDWELWRLTYSGGRQFVESYVEKFSTRESKLDFKKRKKMTPTGVFAKAALNEIKNSIFERLNDVSRQGGPATYTESCKGSLGGVDLRGSTMNWFIGHCILPELLPMKRVGVYVDNFAMGPTQADKGDRHPYLYVYKTEDIRNWSFGLNNKLVALQLRDHVYEYDPQTGLPTRKVIKYRQLRLIEGPRVQVQFFKEDETLDGDPIILNLPEIPFEFFELTESLLKDVAVHQIAITNLESSDISYILHGNYPFYTEQTESTNTGAMRGAQRAYQEEINGNGLTATKNGVTTADNGFSLSDCAVDNRNPDDIEVGATRGRRYGKGLERPDFIAPPTEPLLASMQKQENLKNDIRKLVHLALSSTQAKMASAESKKVDQQGLEAGLAQIGLELEHGERRLAQHWSNYENAREVATVTYPEHWSLKSADEINREVKELKELREEVPSLTFKKQINKRIVAMILGTRVSNETINKIDAEIQASEVQTSDPKVLIADVEAGLLSIETGSKARCYPAGETEKAKIEHAERLARINAAQSDPAARGIPDKSVNPTASSDEKEGKPKRGEEQ